MTTTAASADFAALKPGDQVSVHWHGRQSVHDSRADVVRVGDGTIEVRETGYGARLTDIFEIRPEYIGTARDCARCRR